MEWEGVRHPIHPDCNPLEKIIWVLRTPLFWAILWRHHSIFKNKRQKLNYNSLAQKNTSKSLIDYTSTTW